MDFDRSFITDPCELAGDGNCDGPVRGINQRTTGYCFVGDYEDCGTQDVWEGVELRGPLPAINNLRCFKDLTKMYAFFSWAWFA